jgi:hypothetical protein
VARLRPGVSVAQALRNWIPEAFIPLWAEQHPGLPIQLPLPVAA